MVHTPVVHAFFDGVGELRRGSAVELILLLLDYLKRAPHRLIISDATHDEASIRNWCLAHS